MNNFVPHKIECIKEMSAHSDYEVERPIYQREIYCIGKSNGASNVLEKRVKKNQNKNSQNLNVFLVPLVPRF